MIESLNAYEIYLHEKKLSLERNERRREEEREQHLNAIEEGKKELQASRWNGGKKKAISV